MRKITFTSLSAAATLSLSASAAVLAPGSNASITGWAPAAGGTVIFTQSYAFTTSVPPGSFAATGVVEQTITQQLSGELLFGLRISELTADEGVEVSYAKTSGWNSLSVDADFLLGSGVSSPSDVARTLNDDGADLIWSAFSEAMSDGRSSSWMQVLTDAQGYTPLSARLGLFFSDGSRAFMMIAAPAAIPSPGGLALLLGAIGSATTRRRR